MHPSFPALLSPVMVGDIDCRTRIAMAPCTRCQCPGYLPTPAVARYYGRRAADGVGLLISEGTVICERGNGYPGAPGIWNREQVAAWKPVTQAVHEAGGRIACQLWHVGAVAHPLSTGGALPESPSGLSPTGRIARLRGADGGEVQYGPSESLGETRIRELIGLYAQAAALALEAGFDGVEIHGAHGYLIDQFINLRWNRREDDWGGAQRCRFAAEVTRAVIAETGAGRTIFRFSPGMSVSGNGWQRPEETLPLLLDELRAAGLRWLHASNLDYDEAVIPAAALPPALRPVDGTPLPLARATRTLWPEGLIGVGSLSPARAEAAVASGEIDLAAFGRALIANPDFVTRLREGRPLEAYDPGRLSELI
jgi:N-ethylmaleimide reductase